MKPSRSLVPLLGALASMSKLYSSSSGFADCNMPSDKTLLNPDRIRGNYENRIKYMSTPEKVFEYFANYSDHRSHIYLMRKEDLLRAILPFNFWYCPKFIPEDDDEDDGKTESDAEDSALSSETMKKAAEEEDDDITIQLKAAKNLVKSILGDETPSFFALADTNNDGMIDFDEFLLLTTLLTTPIELFETAFRLIGSPCSSSTSSQSETQYGVSRDEFARVLTGLMKMNPRTSKATAVNASIDPRGVKNSSSSYAHIAKLLGTPSTNEKENAAEPCDLANILFPKGNESVLHWKNFRKLLISGRCELQALELLVHVEPEEVLKLAKGDFSNDSTLCIPALAVARSLTSWVSVADMESVARRVDGLTERLQSVESIPIATVLSLLMSIVEKESDLKEAASLICGCGHADVNKEQLSKVLYTLALSSHQKEVMSKHSAECLNSKASFEPLVDTLFTVFDVDGNGKLDEDEFFNNVARKRQQLNLNEQPKLAEKWKKVKYCWQRHMQGAAK